MRTKDALKLIDEVQIIGSARGWDMREKLLDLVHRATLIERKACANACEKQAADFGGVAEGPFVTDFGKHTHQAMAAGALNCAAAIRARSTPQPADAAGAGPTT